ncbi:hypothetical protein [Flavobacterium sp. ZS1P14]|uniref:hypothetical protein n=1 Tax=Flavobacterium sp. ZS1P14 TaxID=3401729 RepID=UPI003AB00A28
MFIRENNKILEINQKHFEEGCKFISLMDDFSEGEIFRDNSLFLSSLSSFGFGKLSKKIIKAITSISIISGLGHQGMYGVAGDSLNDSVKKKFILDFLKKADVGIQDLDTIAVSNEDLPENIEEESKKDFKKGKIIVSS